MPSWETPAETAPANQQQAENEPLLVLTKVTSEEAGESQVFHFDNNWGRHCQQSRFPVLNQES